MMLKVLAVAVLAGACGTVSAPSGTVDAGIGDSSSAGDARGSDGPGPSAVTWVGQLDKSPTVMFGGPSGQDNFCKYTITLQQLDVQIAILPSGQVTSGKVQDLNVEAVVQPCMFNPIPPNIASYQLAGAAPSTGGMTLTFQGAGTNNPLVVLTIELSRAGTSYSARLTFHRNDGQPAVLEWTVTTTIPLAPQ